MKRIIFTSLFSTLFLIGYCQSTQVSKLMPKPVPQSPNVASLGKYGDYNVNMFTGTPEISIPIFEVKSGELNVPISLSYHASGIRYTDQASWVGLGWSLSSGGQVSRSTVGKPDEELYYQSQLVEAPSLCDNYDYIRNSALGFSDTEADVFSYSFPGKSGKFMLSQGGGSPYLIPYEPIKITTDFVLAPNKFLKFEIVDEAGVLNRFGKNAGGKSSSEITSADNGGLLTTSTTAWHLMEMIAPNSDDKVSFNYQPLGSSTTADVSHHLSINDQCETLEGGTCPSQDGIFYESSNTSTITQMALQEIIFEGGKVEFVLGANRNDLPGLKSLDKIKIYSYVNGTYTLHKTIKFIYTYFRNSGNTIDLRLKLDEIQFQNSGDVVVQSHKLIYFTNSFSWDQPTNSRKRDFWGYYNGAPNDNLIPIQNITYQASIYATPSTISIGGGYDRTVHPEFLTEGVLKKVIHPTGGYTEFEFEPHKYYEDGEKLAGGLRITKIISSGGATSPSVVKSYKYGSGEDGYGLKNFHSSQYFFHSEVRTEVINCFGGSGSSNWRTRTYFSNASIDNNQDGSPVVYPYVTEYFGDFSNNTGKIKYEFDNGSPAFDVLHNVPNSTKSHRNSFSWRRGNITRKTTFDMDSRLSETIINYQLFQSTIKYVGFGAYQYYSFPASSPCTNACPNQTQWMVHNIEYFFTKFPQSTGKLMESSVTENFYQPNDVSKFVTKSTLKTIDPVWLQTTQSSENTSTNGEQLITKITYPFSYPYTGAETGSAKAIFLLKEKNVLTPIEQYSIRKKGGVSTVYGGRITSFIENPNNPSHLVPDKVYVFENAAPVLLSAFTPSGMENSTITMDNNYRLGANMVFDYTSNILQVQKTDDLFLSYLWGYNNTLPIAEVRNAKNMPSIGVVEAFYQGFEDVSTAATILPAHTGERYHSGDFSVLYTTPNSRDYRIEYWFMDENNDWQYASAPYVNGMILTDGGAIDDVRIYPKDAFMTTYVYEPLLGINSITDENGKTQFYDYDSFGRLWRIRNENGNIEKQYSYNYKN